MKFYIEQLADIRQYEQGLKFSIVDDEQTVNSMTLFISKGNELLEVSRGNVEYIKHMCEKYLKGNFNNE